MVLALQKAEERQKGRGEDRKRQRRREKKAEEREKGRGGERRGQRRR